MMRTYSAADICRAIYDLDPRITYRYADDPGREIKIVGVTLPEGPIRIQRRAQVGGAWGKIESMGSPMIWRLANALNSRIPINVDRVFGGSYNTRSVLEALLAHTCEIYVCRPGRQQIMGGLVSVEKGHKHIIWQEDKPHPKGVITSIEMGQDCVISEVPGNEIMYEVAPVCVTSDPIDKEIKRRHSQIQVALAEIAHAMKMRAWIAVEDHQISYKGTPIIEYDYIVKNLRDEKSICTYSDAIYVANHIDCMFFNGGLPFAFEVEHTTGVTSGLTRMLSFKNKAEHLNTRYVVVAPDSERETVLRKKEVEQFQELAPLYFPYSQVEELHSFFNRHSNRDLRGINKDFLLNFME